VLYGPWRSRGQRAAINKGGRRTRGHERKHLAKNKEFKIWNKNVSWSRSKENKSELIANWKSSVGKKWSYIRKAGLNRRRNNVLYKYKWAVIYHMYISCSILFEEGNILRIHSNTFIALDMQNCFEPWSMGNVHNTRIFDWGIFCSELNARMGTEFVSVLCAV
jgi:hypothetical protein